jgi:hypothetical protein
LTHPVNKEARSRARLTLVDLDLACDDVRVAASELD